MPTIDPWVAWLNAVLDAPTVEDPPHSNMTPLGEEYGWNGVAWCAITQSLATLHAWGDYILHTAGVADAMARAQQGENGMSWLGRGDDIQVGDLPCYDWGRRGNPSDYHIEGVVNPGTQDKFETIGGNVGDAVRQQWRDRSFVTGFIRLPFDQSGPAPGPTPTPPPPSSPEEEDDVAIMIRRNDQNTVYVKTALGYRSIATEGDRDVLRETGLVVQQPNTPDGVKVIDPADASIWFTGHDFDRYGPVTAARGAKKAAAPLDNDEHPLDPPKDETPKTAEEPK